MSDTFSANLARVAGTMCNAVNAVELETRPADSIYATDTSLLFSDGTTVAAQFWRLLKAGRPVVSLFDHGQRYGLPAPVDAISVLRNELLGTLVVDASMSGTTGDLRFRFLGDRILEVFNFTGFEIWTVTFPDGTCQYSNYALGPRHDRKPRMRIASAANVLVPSILALEARGYAVSRDADGPTEIWRARLDDAELLADDPIQLLGLAGLIEDRGARWQASDHEIEAAISRFKLG